MSTAANPQLLRSLAVAGAIVLVVGVVAHALLTLVELPPFARALASEFSRLFYAGSEFTVWAWYTAVLMATVGVGLGVIAAMRHRAGDAGQPYAVLAAVALLLSIDETAQFHEGLSPLPRALGIGPLLTFDWLVVGIPIAIIGGIVLLVVSRRIDAQLRRGLIIGGAVFLFGAIVLEGLGGLLLRTIDMDAVPLAAPGYQVLLAVEESVEFAGVLIALTAVLAMIEVRGIGGVVTLSLRGSEARAATVES